MIQMEMVMIMSRQMYEDSLELFLKWRDLIEMRVIKKTRKKI